MAMASELAELTETSLLVLAPEDERWLEFVLAHPEALPFHHPSWARVLSESYGYRSFVLAVTDDEGRINAGMPVMEIRNLFRGPRWVSLPFTDRCPPLATDRVMTARLVALADRGIDVEPPASPDGTDDFWTAWVTDPDGYRIELVQWPPGHPGGMTAAG